MWPMFPNMTRDDCRRTLRSLELEAYSNMISVFRAQGPLEENRKKLLEDLRGVLHISSDRHSAEARRVANDELLATIAEQLFGPNTRQGWVHEGRRRIPLLPRGIPQTAYTEIADRAAQAAAEENKDILKKLEAEKLVTPKTNEEELPDADGETSECALPSNNDVVDEMLYPPVVMEDQATKLWETELMTRKRKLQDSGAIPHDSTTTPVKSVKNITVNTNQKHLNLSQIYSKLSQPAASKPPGQSKHSYNQVSKVSTSKSHHIPHTSNRRTGPKHKSYKNSRQNASKSHSRKSQDLADSPSKTFNPVSLQMEYSCAPNSFQASYAQSLIGHNMKPDYMDGIKPKILSSPSMVTESPTMQLLTQPATVPHELGVSDGSHAEDPSSLQAKATPAPKQISGKPCHLIIKKKGEASVDKRLQMSDIKILQKPSETSNVKLLFNRQVVVAPSTSHKVLNTPAKIATTKILGSNPKPQTAPTILTEKMIVVSKPDLKHTNNSKIIVSSGGTTLSGKDHFNVSESNIPTKNTDSILAKAIPASDCKVSAKTFLLNPKSGQKMVLLQGKPKTKTTVPLLHFKGVPTMKFMPVNSQPGAQVVKSSPVTGMSKSTIVNAVPPSSSPKIVSIETIKTANMADIVPVKGLTPVLTNPKPINSIVRPSTGKGSVIVVQKGATIDKALTFNKNGNDVSKIIMGKNVNQLLHASSIHKQDNTDGGTGASNVIVLELNSDQTGQAKTMSEILEGRGVTHFNEEVVQSSNEVITEDTPILFETQISDEQRCNTNSLDLVASNMDVIPMEETEICMTDKEDEIKTNYNKETECVKDNSSSVTDWEMELDTVSRKEKDDDDKLNSLHLDLGMSSDSETDFIVDHKSKSKLSPEESIQRSTSAGDNSELFASSTGLAQAGRTLLSQLQDEGSSSNDSSFALNKTKVGLLEKLKGSLKGDLSPEKLECEALNKAKEKLTEKVAEAKSQQKRIDVYSTAITTSDINLESFSYLEESMIVADEIFAQDTDGKSLRDSIKDSNNLDIQLSQLLVESSSDHRDVRESLPLNK